MRCTQAKSLFSPYLDGAVSGTEMHALTQHLADCIGCKQQYDRLQKSVRLVGKAGRRRAPADLALNLRLAISREAALRKGSYWKGLQVRWENALDAFVVPVTAGLVAAVGIFAFLIGSLALPLQADNDDVPLMLYTAPQLQQSAFGLSVDSINDDSLVIEAYVDSNGRVQDYRILSDSKETKELLPRVKNMLIFTTFQPATSMGRPTAGRAVLSFSKINVKG
ncbi:MAG TPA: zf-HC2 domain-containing protein [Terriglobales bacterium]|nr:zf-HC2 domain-containing protein [Terriglobales bacterium]